MISPSPVNLIPLSRCENTLKLPQKTYWRGPLPPIAVGGLLVTPISELVDGVAVNLTADLGETLFALYPTLSWSELVVLSKHTAFTAESRARLLSFYGYRWNEDLERISELPLSEISGRWLSEKGLGPREIAPLLIVGDAALQNRVVEKIAGTAATRSHGARLIELLSEILASPSKARALLEKDLEFETQPELWIRKLEAIRFPTTAKRDSEIALRLKTLDLPLKVKAEFRRSGDETGIELKISARAPHEMHRLLAELNSKSWEAAWKSSSPSK
ncbi:MAG: hypothetical protein K2X47_09385 [Bdellovibrionales bacterium]|nr:hypothetical protein [Bdellovibrionales bacterium]